MSRSTSIGDILFKWGEADAMQGLAPCMTREEYMNGFRRGKIKYLAAYTKQKRDEEDVTLQWELKVKGE